MSSGQPGWEHGEAGLTGIAGSFPEHGEAPSSRVGSWGFS
ncbi:hypothetical protein HMPREF0580_0164 [Mobiluncus mulieris ATCC 35239]|uniref:Uncharacterized protein n=1 Tax=Mobiluncus mulieris ATCC 35239 TaxID=871571 RepID=E0QMQ0_9ACTO|nr:hypothetical protein HMPREF0580_0164 [Mobiluncus mulieris ATCC 35239]